jgi:signal transduction histidine kinase
MDIREHSNEPVEKLLIRLRDRAGASGYKFTIVNRNAEIILSSVPEYQLGTTLRFPMHTENYILDLMDKLDVGDYKYAVLKHPQNEQSQIVIAMKQEESMIVISTQLDEVVGNAQIANKFFVIVSLSLLLVILLATYVLSKKLVKPILVLNKQVEEIANFNFDSKYERLSDDELGQLGKNINHISVELEKHITDLKTSNQFLKDDMVMQRRFLASIAHEFKSPIGIIKGYAESIKLNYYATDLEKNEFTDYIVEESDRLSRLVEDMIMLAQLDNRQFTLELSEVNLSELIQSSIRKKHQTFESKGFALKLEVMDNIILQLDERRVEQVLENLVSNALRYSSKEAVIEISLQKIEDQVVLKARNQCDCIKSSDLEQLIKPFYRIEESRSRNTGGHGLGLSIVNGLVEAHGGSLDIDYQDGMLIL